MKFNYNFYANYLWPKEYDSKYEKLSCHVQKVKEYDSLLLKQINKFFNYNIIDKKNPANRCKDGFIMSLKIKEDNNSYINAFIDCNKELFLLEENYKNEKSKEYLLNCLNDVSKWVLGKL